MSIKNKLKNIKNKYLNLKTIKKVLPLLLLLVIFLVGSYAYIEIVNNGTIAGTLECYTVNYTKGQDISGELALGTEYTSGKSTDIVMYSDPNCATMTGTLYITTNNTSTMDFSDEALRYTVVVNNEVVSEGAVDGTANQVIYQNFTLNTTETIYKVYIWLNSDLEDTTIPEDETYSGFIHAEAVVRSDVTLANEPNLVDNSLIPVYYDETIGVWKKADYNNENNQWYNYNEKKWANAVLVRNDGYKAVLSEKNRSTNIDIVTNTYTNTNHNDLPSYSDVIFNFKTGANGGTLSFDYNYKFENENDSLRAYLNDSTIFSKYFDSDTTSLSNNYTSSYSVELAANTSYELYFSAQSADPKYFDNLYGGSYSISNFVLPSNLEQELVVSSLGKYPWTNTLRYYDYYDFDDDGNYLLKGVNYDSDGNLVGKYICSDLLSVSCEEMYQIKSVNSNKITSVDVFSKPTKTESREFYKNASSGVNVLDSDILAFYVWIPRFKYKVWNVNKEVAVDTYNAENSGIDIIFEEGTKSTGTVKCDEYDFAVLEGEGKNEICTGSGYYTHPAFTFGNDELTGFWVGKFELSSENRNLGSWIGDDLTPRILPNVLPWNQNYVDNFWKVIYNMQTTNNIYGLPTNRTIGDSHMINNMEWGALAYFTYSKYGICNENSGCTPIPINSSSPTYTGYSAGGWHEESTYGGEAIKYNETIKEAVITGDTTGQITPIILNNNSWIENSDEWTSSSGAVLTLEFTLNKRGVISFEYAYADTMKYSGYFEYQIINEHGNILFKSEYYNEGRGNFYHEDTGEYVYLNSDLLFRNAAHRLESGTYEIKFFNEPSWNSSANENYAVVRNIKIYEGGSVEKYTSLFGKHASTTGNIYGIFDVNGGNWEAVFANISYDINKYTFWYGDSETGNEFYSYDGNEKYITTYIAGNEFGLNDSQIVIDKTRLGDAIGEVITIPTAAIAWENWSTYFAYYGGFFKRGNRAIDITQYGIFVSNGAGGFMDETSTRAVLVGF